MDVVNDWKPFCALFRSLCERHFVFRADGERAEQCKEYWDHLKRFDYEAVKAAVWSWEDGNDRFPTIAQLKQVILGETQAERTEKRSGFTYEDRLDAVEFMKRFTEQFPGYGALLWGHQFNAKQCLRVVGGMCKMESVKEL